MTLSSKIVDMLDESTLEEMRIYHNKLKKDLRFNIGQIVTKQSMESVKLGLELVDITGRILDFARERGERVKDS